MIDDLVSRSRQRVARACAVAVLALAAATPVFAWEPSKPVEFVVPAGTGGGADQMARLIQGIIVKHKLMKESLIVANKSGGAGAEGFLVGQGGEGRSAQDHHHAVQSVHHADGDRRALQLEGHDAGVDDGARPVRAVGQRRHAVQDGQPSTSPPSRRRARTSSRWAAPAPSRKTRSSPSASRRPPAPSSSTCRSRAAARWPCSWSAATSTRRSTTRSRPSRSGGRASCARCACSTTRACPTRTR